MKRSALICICFFISLFAFAQKPDDFKKLITQTNAYFATYETLRPSGEYYALNKLGLTKEEIKQVIKEYSNQDNTLSKNKDSILQEFGAIDIIQDHIVRNIKKIVAHPDFNKYDITTLLTNSDLLIVKSGDNKLYNFSFDAKNGGTARMRVSIMQYAGFDSKQMNSTIDPYSIFASDGYGSIDTIYTPEGIKYILTGSVQGCSQCFVSYITLIKVKDNTFIEEFFYSIDSRDYETGVSYDPKTKMISISYQTDDLTSYCTCENQANQHGEKYAEMDQDSSDEEPSKKRCECKFIFDGSNFKLIKEGWEIIETK